MQDRRLREAHEQIVAIHHYLSMSRAMKRTICIWRLLRQGNLLEALERGALTALLARARTLSEQPVQLNLVRLHPKP